MANFNLVVNSKFKPFSYQELVAPVLIAAQAHQELENQYSELATKANVWEKLANEQPGSLASKMYQGYADDLNQRAEQLAREGLNVNSRKAALDMRNRYSKEILPIETAYNKKQEQVLAQRDAIGKDNSVFFSRNAANTSIDDYIKNPLLSYATLSGNQLAAQVAQGASAMAKQMRDNPEKWRSILGNSYYEITRQKGFSTEAVLDAINNNEGAAKELLNLVEGVVDSSGVRNWKDETALQTAYTAARRGLWSAVGETTYQNLENWRAKQAASLAAQKELARYKAGNVEDEDRLPLNIKNIYSQRELKKQEKEYKDTVDKYTKKGYFIKKLDGSYELSLKGWKAYNHKTVSINPHDKQHPEIIESDFKQFMTKLGFHTQNESAILGKWTKNRMGELWKKYVEDTPEAKTAIYDANKISEVSHALDATTGTQLKKLILTNSSDKKIEIVDWDNKLHKFVPTGDVIKREDLIKDGFIVTESRDVISKDAGKEGGLGTVMVLNDKGETYRIRRPDAINPIQATNTRNLYTRGQMLAEAMKNGNFEEFQKYYNAAMQGGSGASMQIMSTEKPKPVEHTPKGY